MNMIWKNLKQLIEYSKDGILSKVLVKNNKLNVTLFCMAAGTEMSEHTSTKEGTVFVLEGKGTFDLEGEEIVMKPGILIHMPKNAVHLLRAKENMSFVLTLCG
jgi:nitric oxide dioxygenase